MRKMKKKLLECKTNHAEITHQYKKILTEIIVAILEIVQHSYTFWGFLCTPAYVYLFQLYVLIHMQLMQKLHISIKKILTEIIVAVSEIVSLLHFQGFFMHSKLCVFIQLYQLFYMYLMFFLFSLHVFLLSKTNNIYKIFIKIYPH